MKILQILSLMLFCGLTACNKKATETSVATPTVSENQISYTIEYTGTGQSEEVTSNDVTFGIGHNVYPVLNIEGERDLLSAIYHIAPEGTELISRFGFSFLFSLPNELFASEVFDQFVLTDIDSYPDLLFDNDPENGRRVCLTKENNQTALFNACASEGWYGDAGNFHFEFTHHEIYYDEDEQAWLYTEGVFHAETHEVSPEIGNFKLSNGSFKVNTPLSVN